MDLYESFYYESESCRCPVKEFIDSLDPRGQRKFFFVRGLLQEFGHKLPLPHARYIGDGIFELRFGGEEGFIRVLYFFFERNKIIFTNGFLKKSDKTPIKEKQHALERKRLFLGSIKGVD